MCVVSFVKLKFLLIFTLVLLDSAEGFRLIHSSKKESASDDHKNIDKSNVFKGDKHSSTKERYVNQSIKIESKSFQTPKNIDENDKVVLKLDEKLKAQLIEKISKQNITKSVIEFTEEKKPTKTIKIEKPEKDADDKPKQKIIVKNETLPLHREKEKPPAIIKDVKPKSESVKPKKEDEPVKSKKEEAMKPKKEEEPVKLKIEEPVKSKKVEPVDIKPKKESIATVTLKSTEKKDPPKPLVEKNKPKTTPQNKTQMKTAKASTVTKVEPLQIKQELKSIKTADQKITKELRYNLPSFFMNFGSSSNEECRKQGQIFLENFKNNKLWALKMFDSSAKIPSGILKGNLNQFGDYDQCLDIFTRISENETEPDVKIAGKYCLALIDISATTQEMKLPVNLAQGRALIRSKIQDPGHFIPRFTTIKWGVCIPSGCTSEDVEEVLRNTLQVYNGTHFDGIKLDISVEADDCTVRKIIKKSTHDDLLTFATIGLLIFPVIVTCIATVCDNKLPNDKNESSKLQEIFMSFSLKRTFQTLFKWESEKEEIKCIHGIRTICTLFLYLAHKIIPLGHTPFTNRVEFTETANNVVSVLLRMSIIYTDSFLLLSGVLLAYHMSKDMEIKGYIPWLQRIFARIIRLTPSLLVVLLYYAYVMDYLNNGPLWNTVIASNSKICKGTWWRNLLFIQNLYPFEEMCATQTHQLALDMQLFFTTPVLVWLLYRKPLMGVIITLSVHILSVVLRYYTTLNYRLSLVIYHGISISQLYRTANMMYASTMHRATPYIAGVSLGVLLQQIKPNYQINKALTIIGWIIAAYFMGWTLYAPSHLSSRTYKYDVNEAAQFASLSSVSWSLALSWVIFSCQVNNEGYINSFLSSYVMVILSRLSYTMYLVQFIVFFYKIGTMRTSTDFDPIQSLDISEFIIVMGLSVLLTLIIDLPVQKIKSILMKPHVPIEHKEITEKTNDVSAENTDDYIEDEYSDEEEEEEKSITENE